MQVPKGTKPKRMKDRTKHPRHLRWVADLPCIVCDMSPGQAHHLLKVPRHMQTEERHGHSAGKKAHDSWAVPLCGDHHRELHLNGNEDKWADKYGLDLPAMADWFWRHTNG